MNHAYRRTREVTRSRLVPETHDGHTEMVEEFYTEHIPVPPRDWDRAVLRGVAVGTGLILALAVAWSTASIGALLALSGIAAVIAYGVAAVFDLAWIIFMGLEWLARYEPAKAETPRRAGYAALAVAMVAVCTHGCLTGGRPGIAVGIIGSVVSAIAKGVWSLAIRHTAKPLTPLAQQWVNRQMSDAGAQLAMAAVRRQLARARAELADHHAAYALETGHGPGPDKPSGQRPDTVPDDVRNAVLVALATMSGATPEEISNALAGAGFDASPDTVRSVSGQQDTSSGTVLHIAPHTVGESIADTVRRAVRSGLDKPDMVLAAVRRVHGHDVKPDTVAKTLKRIAG